MWRKTAVVRWQGSCSIYGRADVTHPDVRAIGEPARRRYRPNIGQVIADDDVAVMAVVTAADDCSLGVDTSITVPLAVIRPQIPRIRGNVAIDVLPSARGVGICGINFGSLVSQ